MNKFDEGTVAFHKATSKRCVVIKMNDDGTVKVRTEDDLEKDYFQQELKTLAEVEAENAKTAEIINRDPFDPYS